ncbi:MAG: hypothetical protein AUH85_07600 [Chloroflexi bacterium 13_1_40CM_4_68_4]|nr:MAG: hypothetical protein AUH85_07600 [Chloroflexi bacterium 13_1_40CM_4_68_4]
MQTPQDLILEPTRGASCNEFDGERVGSDLLAHRDLWRGDVMGDSMRTGFSSCATCRAASGTSTRSTSRRLRAARRTSSDWRDRGARMSRLDRGRGRPARARRRRNDEPRAAAVVRLAFI